MKKSIAGVLGTLLTALFVFDASANAKVRTKTPSLSIPTVTNKDTTISGTATKNVEIYVKLDNQKTVATTQASSDGKYTIKLPKRYAVNTQLYVYAQPKNSYNYLYRIATVKAASTATTTSSKTDSKKTSTTTKKDTTTTQSNAKVSELMGKWKSSASGKYTQLWEFNNTTGLNQTLYKNREYNSKILSNAVFNVKSVDGNVIKMTYRGKGEKKTSTMYIRMVSSSKFYLVNSKNELLKVKVGSAAAATYSFTKLS